MFLYAAIFLGFSNFLPFFKKKKSAMQTFRVSQCRRDFSTFPVLSSFTSDIACLSWSILRFRNYFIFLKRILSMYWIIRTTENNLENNSKLENIKLNIMVSDTAWKVSVFRVVLVRIFPQSDQNNYEYGHFLRSKIWAIFSFFSRCYSFSKHNFELTAKRTTIHVTPSHVFCKDFNKILSDLFLCQ